MYLLFGGLDVLKKAWFLEVSNFEDLLLYFSTQFHYYREWIHQNLLEQKKKYQKESGPINKSVRQNKSMKIFQWLNSSTCFSKLDFEEKTKEVQVERSWAILWYELSKEADANMQEALFTWLRESVTGANRLNINKGYQVQKVGIVHSSVAQSLRSTSVASVHQLSSPVSINAPFPFIHSLSIY